MSVEIAIGAFKSALKKEFTRGPVGVGPLMFTLKTWVVC